MDIEGGKGNKKRGNSKSELPTLENIGDQIKKASKNTVKRTDAALQKARTKGRDALSADEERLVFDEIHRLERQMEQEEFKDLSPDEWTEIHKQVEEEIKERDEDEKKDREEVMRMPIDERIRATFGSSVVNYFFSAVIPRDFRDSADPDYWKFKQERISEIVHTARNRVHQFVEKYIEVKARKNDVSFRDSHNTPTAMDKEKQELARSIEAILIEVLTDEYDEIHEMFAQGVGQEIAKQVENGWNISFQVEKIVPDYLKRKVLPDSYPNSA